MLQSVGNDKRVTSFLCAIHNSTGLEEVECLFKINRTLPGGLLGTNCAFNYLKDLRSNFLLS